MTALIAGLTLFIGIHLLPATGPLRAALIERFGAAGYKIGFSLLSLAGFGLIIWGKASADFIMVWQPPAAARHVTQLLMLPSMILLAGIYLPTNLRRLTPHPMMWATFIWAIAHLVSNGDLASMLLFSAFAAWALFAVSSANARGAAKPAGVKKWTADVVVLAVGLTAYGAFSAFHGQLFGVTVLY